MRRLVTAAVLVAALCGSGGAGAADFSGGSFFFIGTGDLRTLQGWDLPASFEGTVTVNFQSDFGTGHTVWSPGQPAQLTIAKLRTRKGIRYTAFLASTGSHGVTARVDRPGGLCTDFQSNLFDIAATEDQRDGVMIGLAGPSARYGGFRMAETRCGGPLADDIGRALPMVRLTKAQLDKGGFDIDLRGNAPLSVPGMTASVDSTVVVHVGKRSKKGQPRISQGKTKPYRGITVKYAVERVSGSVPMTVRGAGVCAELDSCDADETATQGVAATRTGTLSLSAYAPRRRPVADLRAAVGLGPGNLKGIDPIGAGAWSSPALALSVATRRDGMPVCKDTRHVPELELSMRRLGARMILQLMTPTAARTICPGPALSEGVDGPPLATGSIPIADLAHKRIQLHLTKGVSIDTDGWTGSTKPDVTVTLVRKRVSLRNLRY